MEPIQTLLQQYVKVQEVLEDDQEFNFKEPEQEGSFNPDSRIESSDMSASESNVNRSEYKDDGSGCEEEDEIICSEAAADDKGSREKESQIMTLEQITQEWMTFQRKKYRTEYSHGVYESVYHTSGMLKKGFFLRGSLSELLQFMFEKIY